MISYHIHMVFTQYTKVLQTNNVLPWYFFYRENNVHFKGIYHISKLVVLPLGCQLFVYSTLQKYCVGTTVQ